MKSLLILPIYKHTEEVYDRRYEVDLSAARAELEMLWRCPFGEIPQEQQVGFNRTHRYLPWKFNDVVGYLEVLDQAGGRDLLGCIYLKRRHFPRGDFEHRWHKPLNSQEVLYFRVLKEQVVENSATAHIEAILTLVRRAQRDVRQAGSATREAVIPVPLQNLGCMDFTMLRGLPSE